MELWYAPDKIKVMLQLLLAYLFAAGTTVTLVYLARQNRKQGWQRPAPKWFGIELENHEAAPLETGSEPDELLPEILQLNRALAAHGTSSRPRVESELETSETPEPVGVRRV